MMQYQAGYILGAVRDNLFSYVKSNGKEPELNGLLHSLSTFDIETTLCLDIKNNIQSILAVSTNIVTRGLPTLPSIFIEQTFANALGQTFRFDDSEKGQIRFPLVNDDTFENTPDIFFNALHTIDPRVIQRESYLDLSNTDSDFERNFLLKFIPENCNYLTQLLEKQRSRASFTRNNSNRGRVDFSFEIPYSLEKTGINRYKKPVTTKCRKTFIIEVDGKKYHTDLIDDLKDFELAEFSNNVSHIKEDSIHEDIDAFIQNVTSETYVKLIEGNYKNSTYLTDFATVMVLAPIGIARIQRVFLQYLMANYKSISQDKVLTIAVVERDIPCAYAAFNDLEQLLDSLNELSATKIFLPEIELSVFTSSEFVNHPLHGGNNVGHIDNFINSKSFDLVFDISLVRKTGIFKSDSLITTPNKIVIRNSHYIHYQTTSAVISAPGITYRPLVVQLQNEIFEVIELTSNLLKKLLQDIFRKTDFRAGQLPILNRVMQLKSVVGLLPTGGGKSLTYQLAAMLQPGTTIVVDPIRSLMIDQYNGLNAIGIDKCEFINSTLTTAQRNFNQHNLLAKGQLQFLFVSPERFVISDFRKALDNAIKDGHYFSYAVIDEVHCVSEWGHDFRTPYLNLGENVQKFCSTYTGDVIPIFGLTATASFDVLADIERELCIEKDDGNAVIRFENSVRDEINYRIEEVTNSYENLDKFTERSVRESIGKKKQEAIFRLIDQKENLINIFNKQNDLHHIINHSFQNYVSSATQQIYLNDRDSYVSSLYEKLHIHNNPFEIKTINNKKKYGYGVIVFTPHRKGWLGIKNNYNSHGIFDNPQYVDVTRDNQDIESHYYQDETLGYFMGSGDDENSDRIDQESFKHLELFQEDEESVMVATKAFGMGIDKPNVRLTIHVNIPQSIESFVQEAGRAGRDGKVATSIILYNNDILKLSSNNLYHLDKDILMFFHSNSFKGQIKERVMIFELRNNIAYPNTNNLQLLTEQLNELYGNEDVKFELKLGRGNHVNRVFVSTFSGMSIGYIYLDTQRTGTYSDFGDTQFCNQLVEWIKGQLPFNQFVEVEQIRMWFSQTVVNSSGQIGLERILSEMKHGDKKELVIPFTNRYYSKKEVSNQFSLNQEHLKNVLENSAIKQLIESEKYSKYSIEEHLRSAVLAGLDYQEFISSLKIEDAQLLQKLLQMEEPLSRGLQKIYFSPRSSEDTAKAIYRLVSIGIIDSYTIDYQNKLYKIIFTKKTDDAYYSSLKELIARYTSVNVAESKIAKLRKDAEEDIKANKATVISKCLEYLTDFIYEKIKEKRLQAIEDMVRLCQSAIKIEDPLEHNEYIKDEIYYYFNAKYSRRKFMERTSKGEFPASMPDDVDNELEIINTIEKYIKLVEDEETGEFISNVKHLRGSTMRILRSHPDRLEYHILKSFSLFILAATINGLLNEAIETFVKGLTIWRNTESDLNIDEFVKIFKVNLKKHVSYDVDNVFHDIDDYYYASYYAEWTSNFNKNFLRR
jgi:ATP-dependent DNA helicase RecQ